MTDDAERPDDDGEHPLAPEDQRKPMGVEKTRSYSTLHMYYAVAAG